MTGLDADPMVLAGDVEDRERELVECPVCR